MDYSAIKELFVNTERHKMIISGFGVRVASPPCGTVVENDLNVAFQGALSEI